MSFYCSLLIVFPRGIHISVLYTTFRTHFFVSDGEIHSEQFFSCWPGRNSVRLDVSLFTCNCVSPERMHLIALIKSLLLNTTEGDTVALLCLKLVCF